MTSSRARYERVMGRRGTRFSPVAGRMARGGPDLQCVIRDSVEGTGWRLPGVGLPAYPILRV